MISYLEALDLIKQNTPKPKQEVVDLDKSLGMILAKDIKAICPLPVMDNSAMDGFALNASDVKSASPQASIELKIKGDICAGDTKPKMLKPGECYRIMTGAPIPKNANSILIKEHASINNNKLIFDSEVDVGKHIRRKGEEIKRGSLILKKGSRIHAGTIAVLASQGLDQIPVIQKPKIAVISTGSELIKPGKPLKAGQIYDSNSYMLKAMLQEIGIHSISLKTLKDKPEQIQSVIQKVLANHDMVIIVGGVSVGEYDFVKQALEEQSVKQIFWRVDQKPGKPLYFGRKNKTLVFGLPGNPASAYICFFEYVNPAICHLMGSKVDPKKSQYLPLEHNIRIRGRQTQFLKAKVDEKGVHILNHQGSHMITSLHAANAIAVLEVRDKEYIPGELIEVHILNQFEVML